MKLRATLLPLALAISLLTAQTSAAQNCAVTSVGFEPLNDLGTDLYLSRYQGGLYPNGSNAVPAAHSQEGRARAAAIQPLDTNGNPNAGGKVVLLSIGMSNTTQSFCNGTPPACGSSSFIGLAAASPDVEHEHLVIANGAAAGQIAQTWDDPSESNYDRVRDEILAPLGVSEAQVRVVWIKLADSSPTVSLPDAAADAFALESHLADTVRAARVRYPNLELALLSSRIYAGYATSALNPEPYAYESGFAVKWLIEAQIQQMASGVQDSIAGNLDHRSVAPWLGWAAYFWADGTRPRSDGLVWNCSDVGPDGTHPSSSGKAKTAGLLFDFMLTSPFTTPWFRADGMPEPEPWSEDEAKCFTKLSRRLASVTRAQLTALRSCVKRGARAKLAGSIEDCVANVGGRVAKARARALASEAKRCTDPPPLGYVPASGASDVAASEARALAHDVFGDDLDAALVLRTADRDAARCQSRVLRAVGRCQLQREAELRSCTTRVATGSTAPSADDLAACLDPAPSACDPTSGEPAMWLAGASCAASGVTRAEAFPGCADDDSAAAARCLDRAGRCRLCRSAAGRHGLPGDCDVVDDGIANSSCAPPDE